MQMRRFARDCSFVRSYAVRSPARALIGFAFAQNDSLVSGFRSGGGCVFASVFVSRFGAEKRSQFRGLVQTAVVRKRFTAVGARFQFWAREAVPFWGVFLGPVLVPKRGPSFGVRSGSCSTKMVCGRRRAAPVLCSRDGPVFGAAGSAASAETIVINIDETSVCVNQEARGALLAPGGSVGAPSHSRRSNFTLVAIVANDPNIQNVLRQMVIANTRQLTACVVARARVVAALFFRRAAGRVFELPRRFVLYVETKERLEQRRAVQRVFARRDRGRSRGFAAWPHRNIV